MHQDYIMRIVEQFVQAILAIRKLRIAGKEAEAREQIQIAARSLFRADLDLLLLYNHEHRLDYFSDLSGRLDTEKCVLGADLFYELALVEEGKANAFHLKKLCLYLYAKGIPKEAQFQHSLYFEKVSALIEELSDQPLSEIVLSTVRSYEDFIKSLRGCL